MITERFIIKNMVSKSCIRLLQMAFERFNHAELISIQLGSLHVKFDPNFVSFKDIHSYIESFGFPVVLDSEFILVEQIKIAAIELIHHAFNANSLIRNSDYISERTQLSYDKVSKLFSKKTGITLEKYLILLKIEKAKDLLMNEEHSLSEISYLLGYSSVQYLCNQFKKIVGVTVTQFKESPQKFKVAIEELIP